MRFKLPIVISLIFFFISLILISGCNGLTLPQQQEAAYILQMKPLMQNLTETINSFTKAHNDYKSRNIKLSEYKEEIKEFIEGINICYDDFQEIEAPRRLTDYHIAFSEAMDSYHGAAIHFQSYINTDDDTEMFNHAVDAFADLNTVGYALDKAEEEYQKYLGQ